MKRIILAATLISLLGTAPCSAATFEVDTSSDIVEDDSLLSLREAVRLANDNPGPDVIRMANSLSNDITLVSGDMNITDDLTIDGTFVREGGIDPGKIGYPIISTPSPIIVQSVNGRQVFDIFTLSSEIAVEIRDMIIRNGSTGTINANPMTSVTLRNVTVSDCSGLGKGAVQNNGGTLTLIDCTIENNQAVSGGGIANLDGGALSVINSQITGNHSSEDGGGVFSDLNSSATLQNVAITQCEAARAGGGIFMKQAGLVLSYCTVQGNVAGQMKEGSKSGPNARTRLGPSGKSEIKGFIPSSGLGGGIVAAGGNLTLIDTEIGGNQAMGYGGGVACVECVVNATRATLSSNISENGGGVSTDKGSMMILHDSLISANTAAQQGGGIYLEGTLHLTESEVVGNEAMSGGGVFCHSESFTDMLESVIQGNMAANGGGIFASGSRLKLQEIHVSENQAGNGGGGIFCNPETVVSATRAVISDNRAFGGGGINLRGEMTLVDSAIANNVATRFAGGLLISQGGFFEAEDLEVLGNQVGFRDFKPLRGGGGILNQGSAKITGGTFSLNTSGSEGGGLQNYGTATMNQCTLSRNDSDLGGGACYNAGDLAISGTLISDNTTESNGAGVLSETGTVRIVNSTLSGNRAENGNGGGISAELNSSTDLIHATVAHNHVGIRGGGIHADDANVRMGNSILAGNTAVVSGSDLFGDFTSLDYNVIADPSDGLLLGPTDHTLTGVDPLLGPLANNGGPTLTHNLLAGSPAIDVGSNALAFSEGLMKDQRGFSRFADIPSIPNADDGVDIGAVEILALTVEDVLSFEDDGQIQFTVTLSRAPLEGQEVRVQFDTASVEGGASATDDYTPIREGLLTFSASTPASQKISVEILEDTEFEPNESFQIVLSRAVGATILNSTAEGVIVDDDSPPTPTNTATSTPTPSPTSTLTDIPTSTRTPTEEPSSSPTPHFDYDFDGNGVVDARDLTTLLEVLPFLQKADPFDFAHFWMERISEENTE